MKKYFCLPTIILLTVLLLTSAVSAISHTWKEQFSTSEASLVSIFAMDYKHAFAVGDSGIVAGTSNWGQDWSYGTYTTMEPWEDLNQTHFYSSSEGYIVGNSKFFATVSYEASTGDFNFATISLTAADTNFNGCYALGSNDVWLAGDFASGNNRIYYYNGGAAPALMINGISANDTSFKKIGFANANNGFVVGINNVTGDKVVYRTPDAGANWTDITPGTAGSGSFNALHVLGFDDVWVAGTSGEVYYYNGSWAPKSIPSGVDLYGIYFISADEGWAVGEGGTLYHTINTGTTWSSQILDASYTLEAVSFGSSSSGWVVAKGASTKVYKFVPDPTFTSITPDWVASSSEAKTRVLTIEGTYFGGTVGSTTDAPSVIFSGSDIETDQVLYVGPNTLEVTATLTSDATGTYDILIINPDSGSVTTTAAFTVRPTSLTVQNFRIDGVPVPGPGTYTITKRDWDNGEGPTIYFEVTVPGFVGSSAFGLDDHIVTGEVTIGTVTDYLTAGAFSLSQSIATYESTQFSDTLEAGTHTCSLKVYVTDVTTSTAFTLNVVEPAVTGGFPISNPLATKIENGVFKLQFDYTGDITDATVVIFGCSPYHIYRVPINLKDAHVSSFATGSAQKTFTVSAIKFPLGILTGRVYSGKQPISKSFPIINGLYTNP